MSKATPNGLMPRRKRRNAQNAELKVEKIDEGSKWRKKEEKMPLYNMGNQ